MNIHYKTILHERTEDAPFIGALISAIDCKNRCKGCFNKGLFKYPTIERPAEDIICEIKNNKFNEGIIFGGLEWSEQGLELIELCKLADQHGLKIMIYTGYSLEEFFVKLGTQIVNNSKSDIYKNAPPEIYEMVGKLCFDFFVKNDYYIKIGRYDKNKKTDNHFEFDVKLASDNQKIYNIKKIEDNYHEYKTDIT